MSLVASLVRRVGLERPALRLTGAMHLHRPWVDPETYQVCVDSPIPPEMTVGRGMALLLHGWCFNRDWEIDRIDITVGGRSYPVMAKRMPRRDVFLVYQEDPRDPHHRSYRSGFWGVVPIPPGPRSVELGLRIRLVCGAEHSVAIGSTRVTESPAAPVSRAEGRRVAVCMATYNPQPEHFARQIATIREQTHGDWECFISDDHSNPDLFAAMQQELGSDQRFHLDRSSDRLGFYRNFERSLRMVDGSFDFVALADQDDAWYPEKLETLVTRCTGGPALVYSDMRVVDEQGTVLEPSLWRVRRNNWTDLATLLTANTVTGAACLFRRELLDVALPFPRVPGRPLHDQWLAVCAKAAGGIGFVDQPLYDYIQHGSNALGHVGTMGLSNDPTKLASQRAVSLEVPRIVPQTWDFWAQNHFDLTVQLACMARTLQVRLEGRLHPDDAKALTLFADPTVRTALDTLRARTRDAEVLRSTLGGEVYVYNAARWPLWTDAHAVDRPATLLEATWEVTQAESERAPSHEAPPHAVWYLGKVIQPLRLDVATDHPRRLNLVIPDLDVRYFYGGYITKLNLARCLKARGLPVRVVVLEREEPLPEADRGAIQSFAGLSGVLDSLEIAYCGDRGRALEVSDTDDFIATTWTTATVVQAAVAELGRPTFSYLIQEDETLTFVPGSWAAMAEATYTHQHRAIFSTELLRDHFRATRRGVFAASEHEGLSRSTAFRNAITDVAPSRLMRGDGDGARRLLFYARPEAHAARNMFELGYLVLKRAVEQRVLPESWELFGVGKQDESVSLELTPTVSMTMLPRQSQAQYRRMIGEFDVGLSLMYTPHPSLVPIEMAAAGLTVVTNSYGVKQPPRLAEISANLLCCEPTIDALVDGLAAAVERTGRPAERLTAARATRWPRSWEESFDDQVMDEIIRAIGFEASVVRAR
jgi:hypothetical protein